MKEEKYDSTNDTKRHIADVAEYLSAAAVELLERGLRHDDSKLKSPEKELFDKYTPILKDLEYGSDEYKKSLEGLQVALDHHYANNSHHPQHYDNGIDGMDLYDLIEMFWDWRAAGKRNKGGNIYKSLDVNRDRFKMSDQLYSIFKNTADRYCKDDNDE